MQQFSVTTRCIDFKYIFLNVRGTNGIGDTCWCMTGDKIIVCRIFWRACRLLRYCLFRPPIPGYHALIHLVHVWPSNEQQVDVSVTVALVSDVIQDGDSPLCWPTVTRPWECTHSWKMPGSVCPCIPPAHGSSWFVWNRLVLIFMHR